MQSKLNELPAANDDADADDVCLVANDDADADDVCLVANDDADADDVCLVATDLPFAICVKKLH